MAVRLLTLLGLLALAAAIPVDHVTKRAKNATKTPSAKQLMEHEHAHVASKASQVMKAMTPMVLELADQYGVEAPDHSEEFAGIFRFLDDILRNIDVAKTNTNQKHDGIKDEIESDQTGLEETAASKAADLAAKKAAYEAAEAAYTQANQAEIQGASDTETLLANNEKARAETLASLAKEAAIIAQVKTTIATMSEGLVFQNHFTFTPCGSQGRGGPNDATCRNEWNEEHQLDTADALGIAVANGLQKFEVKQDGVYRFFLRGGAGGSAGYQQFWYRDGSDGATVELSCNLKAGDDVVVVVGQAGQSGQANNNGGGGGGGGSFVYLESPNLELLAAAGGGGGGSYNGHPNTYFSYPGQAGVNGLNGGYGSTASNPHSVGGQGGNGATGGSNGGGGCNGAGWNTAGQSCPSAYPGSPRSGNFLGGDNHYGQAGEGGFGGGASGGHEGGGGGGFSGGGGGHHGHGGGGGGGSYANEVRCSEIKKTDGAKLTEANRLRSQEERDGTVKMYVYQAAN